MGRAGLWLAVLFRCERIRIVERGCSFGVDDEMICGNSYRCWASLVVKTKRNGMSCLRLSAVELPVRHSKAQHL